MMEDCCKVRKIVEGEGVNVGLKNGSEINK